MTPRSARTKIRSQRQTIVRGIFQLLGYFFGEAGDYNNAINDWETR
jgi:hypothetical protein